MAYSPINLSVFIAAYAGALAGMGVSGRVPTDPSTVSYSGLASLAGAYAQAFDTAWGTALVSTLDAASIEAVSEAAWEGRAPQTIDPLALVPSKYTAQCLALIAPIKASDAYVAAQSIVIPAVFSTNALNQGSIDLNATTGDDSNTGLPGAPIKSFARLNQMYGDGQTLVGVPVFNDSTIAFLSNGLALPQATINVVTTLGFPVTGTVQITTSLGVQTVTYGGITGTTLIGCVGGAGVMTQGGLVVSTATHNQQTVNIQGNISSADLQIVRDIVLPPNTLLLFKGATPTVLLASTLTTFVAQFRGTNSPFAVSTQAVITDAAVVSFAAYVNKRIRIVGGANDGMMAYITQAVGATALLASVSRPPARGAAVLLNNNPVNGVFTAGDAYVIEDLITISTALVSSDCPYNGNTVIAFQDLNLAAVSSIGFQVGVTGNSFAKMIGCFFSVGQLNIAPNITTVLINCGSDQQVSNRGGTLIVNGGYAHGYFTGGTGLMRLDFDAMSIGVPITVADGVQLEIGTAACFNSTTNGLNIGTGSTSCPSSSVQMRSQLAGATALWGAGHTKAGMFCNAGNIFRWTTVAPTITGALADFKLGDATLVTARAFDETAGAYTAAISTAALGVGWTNLVAATPGGFGNNAHNVSREAHILQGDASA